MKALESSSWVKWFWLTFIALVVASALTPYAALHGVPEIEAAEASTFIDDGALVVDVRSEKAFAEGHIPGAIPLPIDLLKTAIPAALEYAEARKIVVYCGDGSTLGPRATKILNDAGYTSAVNLKGGFGGWEKAGYQTVVTQ